MGTINNVMQCGRGVYIPDKTSPTLDAYIIDIIKRKKRKEEEGRDDQRPGLRIQIPSYDDSSPSSSYNPNAPQREDETGVAIIDYTVRGSTDGNNTQSLLEVLL